MSEDMGFSSTPARVDHCSCRLFGGGWHFETSACREYRTQRLEKWKQARVR